jgi:hypothetical protein
MIRPVVLIVAILAAFYLGAFVSQLTFEARACAAQWEELTR